MAIGASSAVTEGAQLAQSPTGYQCYKTAVSVIGFASVIFAHPLGKVICTTSSILEDSVHLFNHLRRQEYDEAVARCLAILNNSLYLAAATHGGLELLILSLAAQLLLELYHARAEFSRGHSIEGWCHLFMAMILAKQLHTQARLLQLVKTIEWSHAAAPSKALEAVRGILMGQEHPPFDQLQKCWNEASLQERDAFVKLFNASPQFKVVREELAALVYKQKSTQVKAEWLSPGELNERMGSALKRAGLGEAPAYYHATSRDSLKSILQSGQVEVRHEGIYKGAFVSTVPELGFGNYVLAFNRTIERSSAPIASFHHTHSTHWTGFGKGISVTQDSLTAIIVNKDSLSEDRIRAIQQAAGWDVPVITMSQFKVFREASSQLNMFVPAEWPRYFVGR